MKLDFVAVGPQRTGTTWLYEALQATPGVFVSPVVKESSFFDLNWDRGASWYESLFVGRASNDLVAEVGSTYFHSPDARARIFEHSPASRVIVTLRDPVDRLMSLKSHLERTAELPMGLTIPDALERAPHLVDSSMYARHCRHWVNQFGAGRVTVLLFDDLQADAESYYRRLLSVLSLPDRPLRSDLLEPVNPGFEPRWPLATRALQRAVKIARGAGLHKVVNTAKRTGLGSLVNRPASAHDHGPGSDELAPFIAAIWEDLESLPAIIGRSVDPWIASWRSRGMLA